MGWRRGLDSAASGGGMKTLSRREVLMALLVMPVVTMFPRVSVGAPRMMTVNEAMRYLCDEVFPSPRQKQSESHCASEHRPKTGVV